MPEGCILELNLQSVPAETAGFDPVRFTARRDADLPEQPDYRRYFAW